MNGQVEVGSGQEEQVLLGISAADGRAQWRVVFQFTDTAPPASLDNYAPGLISVTTSGYPGGTSLDELDPVTGRVRWHIISSFPYAAATPAGIVTTPGPDQISVLDTLTGQTQWTATITGGWLPLVAGPGIGDQALPVFPAGPLLVVPAPGPDDSDQLAAFGISNGHRTWQITIPGPVAAPLVAVPGGLLVQAAARPPRLLAP